MIMIGGEHPSVSINSKINSSYDLFMAIHDIIENSRDNPPELSSMLQEIVRKDGKSDLDYAFHFPETVKETTGDKKGKIISQHC